MNLQEICKDERFARGELYTNAGYDLYIQNIEGELNWVNKKGLKTYSMSDGSTSGFTIGDILRNNWKLYQLVDGEMVEIEEEHIMQPAQEINLADFTLEKMTNGLKEYARNQMKDAIAFMNADGDLIDNPLYQKEEHIMQPIEAIRWMRENPGKEIVAVEKVSVFKLGDGIELKGSDGEFRALRYYTWDPMLFFAYTYKELKE